MTKLKYLTKQAVAALLINTLGTTASSRLLQEAFNQTNATLANTTSNDNIPLE